MNPVPDQMPLMLEHHPALGRADFLVSDSNVEKQLSIAALRIHPDREFSANSSRASSFVWPLASSFRTNEESERAISAFAGVANVENAESYGTEVNLPTVVINFLETDAF